MACNKDKPEDSFRDDIRLQIDGVWLEIFILLKALSLSMCYHKKYKWYPCTEEELCNACLAKRILDKIRRNNDRTTDRHTGTE